MAVSGLTITSQRMTVADFSQPFWYEPAAVVVQVSNCKGIDIHCSITAEPWWSFGDVCSTKLSGLPALTQTEVVFTKRAKQNRIFVSASGLVGRLLTWSGTTQPRPRDFIP